MSKCPDPNCDAEVDEAEYGSYAWCDECGHALGEVPTRWEIEAIMVGGLMRDWN